jgi:hypothetical protein
MKWWSNTTCGQADGHEARWELTSSASNFPETISVPSRCLIASLACVSRNSSGVANLVMMLSTIAWIKNDPVACCSFLGSCFGIKIGHAWWSVGVPLVGCLSRCLMMNQQKAPNESCVPNKTPDLQAACIALLSLHTSGASRHESYLVSTRRASW